MGRRHEIRRVVVIATALSCGVVVSACGRTDPGTDVAGVSQTPVAETVATLPATTAPPPTTQVTYVIQSGDTLSIIASRFGVSTKALADFNAITDVDKIGVGQLLAIPPTTLESTTTTAP
jgi:LysM repeat protein